jgi:shikimate dehydrogenase
MVARRLVTNSITGLIGHPVKHSLSPRIHERWLGEYDIKGAYELFDTAPETLKYRVQEIRDRALRGVNVTVPHKQTIMQYLDEIDDTAKRIGAVNTIINENGRLIGTNTDAYGFITNLRQGLGDLSGYLNRVVVLGAGGAARAVVVALKDAGAKELVILNRTEHTAKVLAEEFGFRARAWPLDNEVPDSTTLLINTTSLGMQGKEPLEMGLSGLADDAAVHDIVYAPLETRLLEDAQEQGYATVDGLGMLLYQAQKAFALWHGVEPKVSNGLRAQIVEKLIT